MLNTCKADFYLKKLTILWKSPGISTNREMKVVKIRAGDGVSLRTWAMARICGYKTNTGWKLSNLLLPVKTCIDKVERFSPCVLPWQQQNTSGRHWRTSRSVNQKQTMLKPQTWSSPSFLTPCSCGKFFFQKSDIQYRINYNKWTVSFSFRLMKGLIKLKVNTDFTLQRLFTGFVEYYF